jgi:hypothetical protein
MVTSEVPSLLTRPIVGAAWVSCRHAFCVIGDRRRRNRSRWSAFYACAHPMQEQLYAGGADGNGRRGGDERSR